MAYPSLAPGYVRRKSELWWTGLSSSIADGVDTNLITLLKGVAPPQSGSFAPFFDIVADKLRVFNQDASVAFKVNLIGSWAGSSTNRSMRLTFQGTNGNVLEANRVQGFTEDVITLATFFSVDAGGNLSVNGSSPILTVFGAPFTLTSCLLIAEQTVPA